MLHLELLRQLGGQLLADEVLAGQRSQPWGLCSHRDIFHISGDVERQPAWVLLTEERAASQAHASVHSCDTA